MRLDSEYASVPTYLSLLISRCSSLSRVCSVRLSRPTPGASIQVEVDTFAAPSGLVVTRSRGFIFHASPSLSLRPSVPPSFPPSPQLPATGNYCGRIINDSRGGLQKELVTGRLLGGSYYNYLNCIPRCFGGCFCKLYAESSLCSTIAASGKPIQTLAKQNHWHP